MASFLPVSFWQSGAVSPFLWLRHGVSQRNGGVSVGDYASLNTGLHVGDAAGMVLENRRRVASALGFPLYSLVCAEQVHGAQVAFVCAEYAGRGATELADALPGVDALITNTPDLLLCLFFADCLPVFFVDPVHQAVGVAHAGWKGLAGGVLQNTISAMTAAFASKPADLITAIGPGIGPNFFEVGPEVASHFPCDLQYPNGEKLHVDLFGAARRALEGAGISPENITVSGDCTASLPDLYFSHRRDNGRTGRMAAVIGIAATPQK